MPPPTDTVVVKGTKVEIVSLDVVNLKRLIDNDDEESLKLFRAAESPGFFYLDVRHSAQYLADIQDLYAITEGYFNQPEEVKMKDFLKDQELRGYKPGEYSSLEIPRDNFAKSPAVIPETLKPHSTVLERFTSTTDHIAHIMISRLSDSSLWFNRNHRLEDKHRKNVTSDSSIQLVVGPTREKVSDVPETKHTDFGTLSMVYSDQWVNQIQLPWNKQWAFVEPKPGHAIVNVGDALQALSGNKLHSCLHRATQPADGVEDRTFVLYFLRPEHEVVSRLT